jgi:hypothetical protein
MRPARAHLCTVFTLTLSAFASSALVSRGRGPGTSDMVGGVPGRSYLERTDHVYNYPYLSCCVRMFDTMADMAFWVTELPGGGFAMGEASDEAEARLMIARQQGRASVSWSQRAERYRWTVVLDDGKTSHGWAENRTKRGGSSRKP